MGMKTIVVVGGGYAGIHIVNNLRKDFKNEIGKTIRIRWIDKNSYHLRKVLLFKEIVDKVDLTIPLTQYCGNEVELLQGELLSVQAEENKLQLKSDDKLLEIPYDFLILAVGSMIREVDKEKGGISLTGIQSAQDIRKQLLVRMENVLYQEKDKTMRVSIIGGGTTGIETAAELAVWLQKESKQMISLEVSLYNSGKRLLPYIPSKVGRKVERELNKLGVQIFHETIVERFKDGYLYFANRQQKQADSCIWTTGVSANPIIRELGLPTATNGRLLVGADYRVKDTRNIYALGDAALVTDPATGQVAGMTCKEAIPQAVKVSKIIKLEMEGKRPLTHEQYPPQYCIGLGPDNGLVWTKKWGIDIIITGKLGRKIRKITWDLASIIK